MSRSGYRYASMVAICLLAVTGGLLCWAGTPVLLGWAPKLVTAGSMSPGLSPGDVVLSAHVHDSALLLPGAVVLVAGPSPRDGSYLRRLVRRAPDDALVTRGDANATEDFPPVAASRVLGQVRLVVPAVGLPALWIRAGRTAPLLTMGAVLALWLILGAGSSRQTVPVPPSGARSRRAWPGLALVTSVLPVAAAAAVAAVFAQTSSPSTLTAADLDTWLPSSVTATRVTSTTCQVAWTTNASAPGGSSYDVTDGTGTTAATDVRGTRATITVPVAETTPTVLTRYGGWLSASSTAASPPCTGFPDASVVTATPSTGQIVATWTAPGGNGAPVTSYTASISPGATTCTVTVPATRTCIFGGLTDGITYTVSVAATNNSGTGPAATASAIPYPSAIMTTSRLKLWLDGADSGTMLASPGCTGALTTSAVGCWQDKSSQANNAVQVASSNRPSLSVVNGFQVPSFDGGTSYLRADPALLPTGTTTGTTLAVASLTDPAPASSGSRSVFNYGTLFGGQARQLQKLSRSSAMAVSTGYDVVQGSWTSTPKIIAAEITGTSETIWASGQQPGVTRTGMSNNTGSTYATVGSSGTPAQFWYGQIPEIISFTGDLTNAERRTIEEYLSHKWGTSLTPSAPTGVTASPGDTQASVSWTAPTYDGGAPISSYTVTATPADGTLAPVIRSCASSPCTLTGLTNGGAYTISVAAVNAAGAGPSSTSTPVTPYPDILTGSGALLWLDGADPATLLASPACSGPAATGSIGCWKDKSGQAHDVASGVPPTLDSSAFTRTSAAFSGTQYLTRSTGFPTTADYSIYTAYRPASTSCTNNILSADTGSTHAFYLDPTYGASIWHAGSADSTGVAATANTAYVSTGTFTDASKLASVDYDGVSAVSATLNGGNTGAGIQIGALSGGNNFCGQIAEVGAFSRVLSTTERRSLTEYLARKWGVTITPQAPAAVTGTPGDGQASVAFTAPDWNGGSAVTSYTVTGTPSDGTLPTVTRTGCSASPCTVTGLTNGASYTFTVKALNSLGSGPGSAASAAVVPFPVVLTGAGSLLWLDGADPATLFQDPAMTTPATAAGQSIAAWKDKSGQGNDVLSAGSPPTQDTSAFSGRTSPDFGGSQYLTRSSGFPVSADYSVYAVYTPNSTACTNNILAGDVAGTHAFFLQNSAGPSLWHANSQVGTGVAAAADTAYLSTGTYTEASRTVSIDYDGVAAATGTIANANTNAGIQIGAFAAINGFCGHIGEVGLFSRVLTTTQRRDLAEYLSRKWSVPITPQAPMSPSAAAGTSTATVSWTAPAWDGGSSITSYTVAPVSGAGSCTWSSGTTASCTGLTHGSAYSFTVSAVNAIGAGPPGTTNAVTP